MAASSESTELKLVSSIRYKFAAVSGDEKKLSLALQSQLTSLLEKAGSQHKAVREDVSVNYADFLRIPLLTFQLDFQGVYEC